MRTLRLSRFQRAAAGNLLPYDGFAGVAVRADVDVLRLPFLNSMVPTRLADRDSYSEDVNDVPVESTVPVDINVETIRCYYPGKARAGRQGWLAPSLA
jgi:hypothetical protein